MLDWNPSAENPVGAEYILMKKAPGIPLQSIWETKKITKSHIEALARQIAYLETRFLDMTFRSIGAIYHKGDVALANAFAYTNSKGEEVKDPRFVIGPVVGHSWLLNGRCNLKCDRGPCKQLFR